MAFIFSATVAFWVLAFIWDTKDLFNFIMKAAVSLLALWGFFETLKAYGYIVQVAQ